LICRDDYYTVTGSLLDTEVQNQKNTVNGENDTEKKKVLS